MAKLRDSPDDHFALVGRTADALGLPPEFVEKDYWITELLRSVVHPIEDARVVFKGGTSLSKGYSLIQRFSEDVDILLVVTRAREAGFGKGRVDRILKGLCSRAQGDLGLAAGDVALESSSTGVHRNVRYEYPARYEASAVRPGVLLELGIRGRPEPREAREIRSLLGRFAVDVLGEREGVFDEFAPFTIAVLHPRRTLFEKLSVVHHHASSLPDSGDDLQRAARHLYDIFQLLGDAGVRESLGGSARIAETTAADMACVSHEWGWPHTPRPAGGYAASPAFDARHPSQAILRAGLGGIRDLIVGPVPTIEECRGAIERAADLL